MLRENQYVLSVRSMTLRSWNVGNLNHGDPLAATN
jgi:hypothetical protein